MVQINFHIKYFLQDSLMEESQLEAQKREEIIRMYHTCKEALRIIGEVNMSTPIDGPSPVYNDFIRLYNV